MFNANFLRFFAGHWGLAPCGGGLSAKKASKIDPKEGDPLGKRQHQRYGRKGGNIERHIHRRVPTTWGGNP